MTFKEGHAVAGRSAPKYCLVEAAMLPEIFLKVLEAKELLQTGEALTVGEAVNRVGISRSAFYKYKDSITAFQDLRSGRILTVSVLLRDQPGLLSRVLSVFARYGANILTINQSIPVNGCATITISAETAGMSESMEALLEQLRAGEGVLRAEVLAG
jgi:chorismate mutase